MDSFRTSMVSQARMMNAIFPILTITARNHRIWREISPVVPGTHSYARSEETIDSKFNALDVDRFVSARRSSLDEAKASVAGIIKAVRIDLSQCEILL